MKEQEYLDLVKSKNELLEELHGYGRRQTKEISECKAKLDTVGSKIFNIRKGIDVYALKELKKNGS